MPTAEEQLLADALLRHRPYPLRVAIRRALWAEGEYVPEGEEGLLQAYADSITIDMVPDGYRLVLRQKEPLLGLGPLELFAVPGNPQLLTRCAVWYGGAALAEWMRRGGTG